MATGMASKVASHLEDTAENSVLSVMDRLLGKICTFVEDRFSLVLSLEEELEFLRSIHPQLTEVVVNAQAKPGSGDFLLAVKKFCYDGRDIVEEFDTEVARRQLNGAAHLSDLGRGDQPSKMALWLKVRAIGVVGEQNFKDISLFFKRLCGCFFPEDSSFFFRWKIANEIRDLYGELQKINSSKKKKDDFMSDVERWLPYKTSSAERGREVVDEILPNDFRLEGREEFKKEIKDLLLNESEVTSSSGDSTSIPCVLLITGMGGIGKTTFAQVIYNDPDVKKHFQDLNKWVCVGDDELDPNKVMEEIIKDETRESTLRKNVRSIVEGKRFLIVLDDVWKGKDLKSGWKQLWEPLSHGAKGSWIIVTTREQDVKNEMGSTPTIDKKLNPLSDEECFRIFQRSAFPPTVAATSSSSSSSTGCNIPKKLRDIAMLIVSKKIKGVPLVAKVVGSSLLKELEENVWRQALHRIKDDDVMSAFMWSYRRLPTHLKRCFAYCSVYAKDESIHGGGLIQAWMAFGYIQPADGTDGDTEMMTLEDVGRVYIRHLVRASLLEIHDPCRYKMHDRIHDLVMYVSDHKVAPKKPLWKAVEDYVGHSHLDKLWSLYGRAGYLNAFHDQLQTVRVLRIYDTMEITSLFPSLVHLRSLDLMNIGNLHSLPESLCDLYNLQTLVLPFNLKKLPEGMWKLVNLRHIEDMNTINFARVTRVGKLTSLQTITRWGHFGLSKNGGEYIRQLKNMKQLRGCLHISGLCHLTNIQWARDVELDNKVHLRRLTLDMQISIELNEKDEEDEVTEVGGICSDIQGNVASEIGLFNSLKPPQNLEELEIKNYKGDELPMWMGGDYLLNIVRLTLSNCHGLKKLSPLGHLYNLEQLEFNHLDTIERIGAEVCSTDPRGGRTLFPSLKELSLKNMDALEEWEEPIATDGKDMVKCFPSLEKLHVIQCNKFRCLPTISSIKLHKFVVEGPMVESGVVVKWLNQVSSSLSGVLLSRLDIGAKLTVGSHFDKLDSLEMKHMSKLRSLDIQGLPSLRTLEVKRCEHLEEMLLSDLPSLKDLSTEDCNAVKIIRGSQNLSAVEFAGISGVNDEVNQLHVLQNLEIFHAESLEILRAVDPHTLHTLALSKVDFGQELCSNDQKWLMSWFQNLSSIQLLVISSAKVRGGSFPSFLELRNLHSLQCLSIQHCHELQVLPELPSSLKKSEIYISGCPQLQQGDI